MRRRPTSIMPIFTALLLLPLAGLEAADGQQPRAVVGAIRWDAWYGRNDVVREVERALGPKKFHFRLPFFAQVVSDTEVRIDGDSQDTMNREIAYAAEAGLNYWAFVDYWDDPALTIALRRYREATDKRGLRFCFVEEGARLDRHRAAAWPRLVDYFRDPNYLKVCDGRPLLFFYGKPTATGRADFLALGAAAAAAGLKKPYMVLMGWHPPSDWKDAQSLGFDAVSAYAAGGQYAGAMWPYARLTEYVTSKYWGLCRQHGIPTLTFATAGWDTRPRIEHPVKWIKIPAVPDPTPPARQKPLLDDVTATPAQLAEHVQEALTWTAHNPDLTPANAVIIYAWNENDEGGWLVPTWTGQGQPNTDRIEAVGRVLNR